MQTCYDNSMKTIELFSSVFRGPLEFNVCLAVVDGGEAATEKKNRTSKRLKTRIRVFVTVRKYNKFMFN